ncbi:MAG: phytoene desaturase [Phycisphaerales bacterium]|nr:phytoene desaturase [Phycisphaerales bacterium]
MKRSNPIAVVGAGPGGLASAMLLAASGLPVRVYEAMKTAGGRTGRLTSGRFAFDRGPTFFMMPYVLEEIFSAAGRRLGDYVDLRRLDPMYRLLIGQRDAHPLVIDTTQDVAEMVQQLDAIRPGDGAGFERFMRDNRRKLDLMTPILRRPVRGLRDLLTMDTLKVAPVLKPWQSVHDHLAGYFRSEASRLATSFQSKYLGMSPFECPSLFSILPFIEYEYGIWHPIGGCNALTSAMAAACQEMGVEIRCGQPVTGLRFDGRRLTGIEAAGTMHDHEHAVINADATWALKHLIPAALRGRDTDQRIDSRDYSCSTFMLYLGIRGEVDLPHHTIYTSASYRDNLADIATRGRLSEDPSAYVCNPSRLDPTLAPPGDSSLYVLVPVPNLKGRVDWAREAEGLRQTTLRQLERVFGLADIERRIQTEVMFTPKDWRGMNINFGATFNLAHSLRQMLHRRPQHRLPYTDGLWLVGGGTHPGSGLPVIFLSSQITSRMLCEEIGVQYAGDVPTDRTAQRVRALLPRVAAAL